MIIDKNKISNYWKLKYFFRFYNFLGFLKVSLDFSNFLGLSLS